MMPPSSRFVCRETWQVHIFCVLLHHRHYSKFVIQASQGSFTIFTVSVYALKKEFQKQLQPLCAMLIRGRISANMVTLFTCALCLAYSAVMLQYQHYALLAMLPIVLLVRMALCALDGMIAQATNTQSRLGMVLNEACDVVADIALFGAFLIFVPGFTFQWLLLILLSIAAEAVSIATLRVTGIRSNAGPFGKADRAVYLGIFAVLLIVPLPVFTVSLYVYAGIGLSIVTNYNRLKSISPPLARKC